MRAPALIALVACTLTLTGCGIKGGLYLPEVPTPAPANEAAPASNADDTKTPANAPT